MALLFALALVSVAAALKITTDPTDVANKTYTHIIIGGGTAGLTVANRLAEVSHFNILVIEAGPDGQNSTDINDPESDIAAVTNFSWFYNTTVQAVNGGILSIEQGKVLGGSSSINGMQWTRGTINQYDTFERLGNPGWNSESLFKYMMKSESFHIPNAQQVSLGATSVPSVHGMHGPVSVSYPQPYLATTSFGAYITSIREFFPTLIQNLDVCTGSPNGAARFFYSIIPGTTNTPGGNRRASSAVSYIYPFLNNGKDNVVILVGHQSTSILWANTTTHTGLATAKGVRFAATPAPNADVGTTYDVTASKEVIVAAGALGSPHFLELSGIGNKTILGQAGIPVKVDLPSVGTNLQDQPLSTSVYTINSALPPNVTDVTNEVVEGSVAYIDIEQILGKTGGAQAGQYLLDTVTQRAEAIVATGGHTSVSGLSKALQAQAESIADLSAPVTEMSFAVNTIPGAIFHETWNLIPQVRGTVHVTSSNPSVLPAVNPMYLSNQFEVDLLSNATKASRAIVGTSPLSGLIGIEEVPGPLVPQDATDAEWQAFTKAQVTPVLHPIGTVPMLPKADGGAVDSNLIVYGTANVRVIDSSIIPIQISAHLSATVYGIAEKAADIIKAA